MEIYILILGYICLLVIGGLLWIKLGDIYD